MQERAKTTSPERGPAGVASAPAVSHAASARGTVRADKIKSGIVNRRSRVPIEGLFFGIRELPLARRNFGVNTVS